MDAVEPAEPIDSTEQQDPIEPIERTEPVEERGKCNGVAVRRRTNFEELRQPVAERIIPAPTVSFVASSIRMNAPVVRFSA